MSKRNPFDYHPKTTHKEFQQQVADLANYTGWKTQFWWRSFHSAPGFLDFVFLKPPRLIVSEIKIPPDKLSNAQQEWYDLWKQMPQVEVYIWTPNDWEEIVKILSR